MSRGLMMGVWCGLAIAGAIGPVWGQRVEIGRTAVLGATLPASTTWQVERQVGGSWTGTGVLVAGSGAGVSVRMDGWPGEARYRFQRVAGAVATMTPTVSTGWHLAGQETGAASGQVVIEKSGNLAAWGQETLVFPRADGRYVRALREPLGVRGFFRARVPELPTLDASVTRFTPLPNNEGAAGFGSLYDDMPQIFKDGYVGSLHPSEYHRGGENAAAAGECYELAGPHGRTTVMISDISPTAPPGTVDVGRSYFDLGPVGFAALSGGPTDGGLTAGGRLVPAPVTGPVRLQVVAGSNIYYTQLRAYNYRAGVKKVEVKISGGTTWVNLPRTPFNTFLYQAGGSLPPMAFPVEVRVTSRFDEVVGFPAIGGMADGQRFAGSGQFAVFPELAPVPERRLRPVYADRFTTVPGETWTALPYGGASVTEVDTTVPAYEGTASARITGLGNFSGVTFSGYPNFPRPEHGVFRIAVRSGSPLGADQVGLAFYGAASASSGTTIHSPPVQLPGLTGGWQVFEVPLEASGVPPVIWGFSVFGRVAGALPEVRLDAVGFEGR